MSEKLSELSSSRIAFRVAIFAGVLAVLAWFPSGLDQLLGGLLLLASTALFYEAWIRRWSQRRVRQNLLWAGLSLAGALILLSGWLAAAATPLLATAAVCGAVGAVAMVSERA
jgi:drug/metabolite transporter (DMT)-like permease